MISLKGCDEDVVGMTNMFIGNSTHYGDNDNDVNIKDDKIDDNDDDDDEEEEEEEEDKYDHHGDDDECHK